MVGELEKIIKELAEDFKRDEENGKSRAWYSNEGDCLHVVVNQSCGYHEYIDKHLSLLRDDTTKEVIGFSLSSIKHSLGGVGQRIADLLNIALSKNSTPNEKEKNSYEKALVVAKMNILVNW